MSLICKGNKRQLAQFTIRRLRTEGQALLATAVCTGVGVVPPLRLYLRTVFPLKTVAEIKILQFP